MKPTGRVTAGMPIKFAMNAYLNATRKRQIKSSHTTHMFQSINDVDKASHFMMKAVVSTSATPWLSISSLISGEAVPLDTLIESPKIVHINVRQRRMIPIRLEEGTTRKNNSLTFLASRSHRRLQRWC